MKGSKSRADEDRQFFVCPPLLHRFHVNRSRVSESCFGPTILRSAATLADSLRSSHQQAQIISFLPRSGSPILMHAQAWSHAEKR